MARPLNLVIALLTFTLSSYIAMQHNVGFIYDRIFWLQAAVMVGIMGSGYWINDVFDYRIDQINRPNSVVVGRHISTKKVITAYIVATIVLSGLTLLLPLRFIIVNVSAQILLFAYAWQLKRTPAVGNLVIAVLATLVVLCGGLLPSQIYFKMPIIWTMTFAFVLTFIREVTKDVEDMNGDMAFNLNTLPIMIGLYATRRFLEGMHYIFLLCCYLPVIVEFVRTGHLHIPYLAASIFLVQFPLGVNLYYLSQAQKPEDYTIQSQILKATILGGLLSLLLLK